jgi:hypothetical protein
VLAWSRYAVVLSILTSSKCVCADKQASKSEEEKKVAEAQFKALGEAYEVLSCPEKKQRCVSACLCILLRAAWGHRSADVADAGLLLWPVGTTKAWSWRT